MALAGCSQETSDAPELKEAAFADVDGDRIIAAKDDPSVWLSHGRTYDEARFSPLAKVNSDNVSNLGLAWSYDLGVSRGIEVTPIVVDGVMYVTGLWNVVTALDAKTGEQIWQYDPEIDRKKAAHLCCDAVNRGVAIWKGRVYTGTIDGRLIALNAETGDVDFDVVTVDQAKAYTITGAPRIIDGNVIIGNGGAEYDVRGYVSAYDAETGTLNWRFYTVPGNPNDGFEHADLKAAADTWKGEWWKLGGGGTVWDSMAYDPDLNLLYIGVGNGAPWNQEVRSPGGGDNLYLSSIVALRPDTGDYVWHYQTTPGDTWDYTATQHMVLADLEIEGAVRKVIMQAPKNGFFYVIDRETGEFISANNYVPVNWATHIDASTGRPVEVEAARWPGNAPHVQLPGPLGGHNWHPMSMSADTGLVYIPAQEIPFLYGEAPEGFTHRPGLWNTGVDFSLGGGLPNDKAVYQAARAAIKGRLLAWDPVNQREAWRVEHKGPWNGGVLSTAGNLVFQGTAEARFKAFNASDGAELWSFPTQTGVVAAPITYEIDGEQYIAVASGWGGVYSLILGGFFPTESEAGFGRILVFKLSGTERLPDLPEAAQIDFTPPENFGTDAMLVEGRKAYGQFCSSCHGEAVVSYGSVPNLRISSAIADKELWTAIVRDGALAENGMVGFGEHIDPELAEALRAYVVSEAKISRYTGADE